VELKNFVEKNNMGEIDITSRQTINEGLIKILKNLKTIMNNENKSFMEISPIMIVLELLVLRTFSSAE